MSGSGHGHVITQLGQLPRWSDQRTGHVVEESQGLPTGAKAAVPSAKFAILVFLQGTLPCGRAWDRDRSSLSSG